ncbi:hypothetical protein BKA69DRAFT_372137 [Paraphysoderma sedebokerense]|nr:hypothetical protein BKA69DRAFT_372137 [Paraphysoderma sedebokerense]
MAGGPSPFSGSTKTTLHVHTAIKALSAMISSPHQSQSDSSQTNMFNSQHHSPDFTEALAAVHHIERQQQHHHHQPPSAHDHDSSVSTPPDSSDSLRQRRESRKMGEKRRRDYIQAGMTELSKLVPECTNKSQGEVLQKSINFINQLKQSESQNIDRWTLEKMLADRMLRC